MRQNFRGQADRNTLNTLGQQQRKFDRQGHRLLITAIIGEHPFGNLRAEGHIQRKFRQTCFDITGCCSTISGQDVSPVTLAIDQQIFLPQLHQRIANRGIAMRVILHS